MRKYNVFYPQTSTGKKKILEKRLRVYGLSHKQYMFLFKLQQGQCAICKNDFVKLKLKPNIDHDHNTGKVRGLLCRHCNFGLGFFKDNIVLLEQSIKYLNNPPFPPN